MMLIAAAQAFLVGPWGWLVKWGALLALAIALVLFGWIKGAGHEKRAHLEYVGKQAAETIRIARARDKVTTIIETKYLPQVVKQQVVTETIVKEVPVYVPTSAPDLPGGFRVLHDAAAAGELPDPAAIPHAAAVPAQAAASTVAANYGACRADQLKLKGLQEWVLEQGKVR